ncbi:MAG TPA: cation diffusion facilitator family transporter [Thermoplasmata archaeon]|jgi:cation diffusion facilitator family transporter|nr:cation diffusion facilitator family transporter [Thermoplasmata archaeon]
MRPQVIIIATLLLNASLFAVNLTVAVIGGSRSVLAEAIFTITDIVGSGLLLWGLYLSRRPASPEHPFGRGKERFFWAFVSILVTFTVAGVLVLTEGLDQVLDPRPIRYIVEGLLVTSATLVVSLASILFTLRELRLSRMHLLDLLESANQGLKAIVYQDLVTVGASVAAFVGLFVVNATGIAAADGAGAIAEGAILIAAGFILSAESREYLIGRALEPAQARRILQLVEANPSVAKVRSLQSMLLGPDDALLALRINFHDGMTTDQLELAIDEVTAGLRAEFPVLRHIVIEPES